MKVLTKQIGKMVFSDYINSLPNERYDMIHKLAEVTCCSEVSVYRWLNHVNEPSLLKKKVMAEFIGKPVKELWPDTEL